MRYIRTSIVEKVRQVRNERQRSCLRSSAEKRATT
jgi:hypothetical protein